MPRQFTPQRVDGLLAIFPRLTGRTSRAVEHNHAGFRHVHDARVIEQIGNAGQILERALASGQVIDRQHGMRLATAEGCLKLDNRVAALAVQPPRHGGKQQAHAFRDERALKKSCGVLVFRRCLAGVHGGDVRSELRLKERAFEHVGMGNGYFAPRFHRFMLQSNGMSLKKAALCFFRWHRTGGGFNATPGSNEFVVSARILGPALAFAERVKAIG